MKLSFPLFAAAIHAEELTSGDITSHLDKLESYCNETYGLPAYATGKLTPEQFATKWTNRKSIDSLVVISTSIVKIFQYDTIISFQHRFFVIKIYNKSRRKLNKDAPNNAIDSKEFSTEDRKREKVVVHSTRK